MLRSAPFIINVFSFPFFQSLEQFFKLRTKPNMGKNNICCIKLRKFQIKRCIII